MLQPHIRRLSKFHGVQEHCPCRRSRIKEMYRSFELEYYTFQLKINSWGQDRSRDSYTQVGPTQMGRRFKNRPDARHADHGNKLIPFDPLLTVQRDRYKQIPPKSFSPTLGIVLFKSVYHRSAYTISPDVYRRPEAVKQPVYSQYKPDSLDRKPYRPEHEHYRD